MWAHILFQKMTSSIPTSKTNIAQLLLNRATTQKPMSICAPMVRYSRTAFRELCRFYNTEICWTPMMMSDCFVKSQKYREIEYPIYSDLEKPEDNPLTIAQFAATDPVEFAQSALLVYQRGANGIDLNCGCPQKWAWKEGIGCGTPSRKDWHDFISKCVKYSRKLVPDPNFTISVKFRLKAIDDLKTYGTVPKNDQGQTEIDLQESIGRCRNSAKKVLKNGAKIKLSI